MNDMSDSFQREFDHCTKPAKSTLLAYIRAAAIILSICSVLGMVFVLPVWCCLGFPWPSSPAPLRLIRDHEADLTAYAQRALAGDVGSQPDARRGLLLAECMVDYDVQQVHVINKCLVVDFNLPWFDGPTWELIYAPTMTDDVETWIHPKAEDGWKELDYKELGRGWHYVSRDVLQNVSNRAH